MTDVQPAAADPPDGPEVEPVPASTPEPGRSARRSGSWTSRTSSLDLPSQYPAVTLVESEPPMRALVFPVGLPEGTAMAQALRRMEGRRPMTHELFMQVLQRARIDVIAVRLVGPGGGEPPGRARPHDARAAASGSTAGPPTASCWRCACRCRRRSSSTSACSTRPVTSHRSWTAVDRGATTDRIGP